MQNIYINSKKSLILIDGSYYIFNRYFATYKWFNYQNKEIDLSDLSKNPEFITAFIKHLESDFIKIQKKLKTDMNSIILCMDCSRCDIWRNNIYSKYKQSRPSKINFNSDIFKIFNEHIKKMKVLQIFSDNLEADDIIYLIQKKVKEINSKQQITIITNDNDYLQLIDRNTKIINMQFKDISLRGTLNPKIDLLVKIIFGDKSDNIPKILNGITKEKAIKIAMMTEEERNNYLIENNLKKNYDLNKILISFENIPDELIINFNSFYNISIL